MQALNFMFQLLLGITYEDTKICRRVEPNSWDALLRAQHPQVHRGSTASTGAQGESGHEAVSSLGHIFSFFSFRHVILLHLIPCPQNLPPNISFLSTVQPLLTICILPASLTRSVHQMCSPTIPRPHSVSLSSLRRTRPATQWGAASTVCGSLITTPFCRAKLIHIPFPPKPLDFG